MSKYLRDSLTKLGTEKLFTKVSKEAEDLVKLVARFLGGAATETRTAARESAKLLAQHYGDNFSTLVQRALGPREAADLLRIV
jgi:hypothetical protein